MYYILNSSHQSVVSLCVSVSDCTLHCTIFAMEFLAGKNA